MSVPRLRFKEFSEKWEFPPIGDILKIKSGFGFKASEYCGFGAKLLQIENVGYGKINWNTNSYLPFDYLDKYPELHLKENDIVIALNRPVTNNQLKISKISISDTPSILYQRVGKLCLINESIQPDYIFQVFSIYVKDFVLKQAIGSDQPFISITSLYKYRIPLPSFPEQTKIANFLTSIDEKISQLTQKYDLLKQYKKGVMQQIFSQKLRFKDEDGWEFPEWDEKFGNEVFDSVTDKDHNSDLPILAISQEHGAIPREMIDYNISVTDKSIETYKVVQIGDFIISLRSFQGGIEYSAYKGICSPAYVILRPWIEINRIFFRFYLKTENYIKELNRNIEGIRDGKMISYKYFSEILLPFPSLAEQTKIANFLTAIDDKITQAQTQLDAVKQYKKGLLQQLFV